MNYIHFTDGETEIQVKGLRKGHRARVSEAQCSLLYSSGTEKTSASPGNLLETHTLRPYPRLPESESDAHSSLRSTEGEQCFST